MDKPKFTGFDEAVNWWFTAAQFQFPELRFRRTNGNIVEFRYGAVQETYCVTKERTYCIDFSDRYVFPPKIQQAVRTILDDLGGSL